MKKKIKSLLKHRLLIFCGGIIILLLIPIAINESYKVGNGYVTNWNAADVLAFYGSFLSFAGTVILGIIAIWQNDKAHQLNQQLQKLEQAQYVSMVSVNRVMVNRSSRTTPNYMNTQMPSITAMDLIAGTEECPHTYHIDVEIKNESTYPLVQMKIHPSKRTNGNGQLYGMKNLHEQAVYIPGNGTACFRYIIPCEKIEFSQTHPFQISLDFVNIFDYTTSANLYITGLSKTGGKAEYQYRLLKFTDIRPKSENVQ